MVFSNALIQVGFFSLVVTLVSVPLGLYIARVFAGERTFLDPVLLPLERLIYRLCGVQPATEQTWVEYTVSMLFFSVIGMVLLYALRAFAVFSTAQSAEFCRGGTGSGVQYCGKLYDQHELAGVLGRIDHELPDPDGGTRVPQLRFGCCGPGDRDRSHPGFCSARRPDAGELLV